jgi:hypothetical protein
MSIDSNTTTTPLRPPAPHSTGQHVSSAADITATRPSQPSDRPLPVQVGASPHQALPHMVQMLGDRLGDCVTNAIKSSMAVHTDAVIKSVVEALPKGKRDRVTSSESDADDEEEMISKRPRTRQINGRKSKGPRGDINLFHVSNRCDPKFTNIFTEIQNAFRTFLRGKGLLPSKNDPLPPQVPEDVLRSFYKDGHPTPDVMNMQLDWTASLVKSMWNKRATGLLAEAFLLALQAGEYPEVKYDSKTMTLASLRTLCSEKLNRVHERAHLSRIASETIDEEILQEIEARPLRQLTRARCTSRRQNVCLYPVAHLPSSPLTLLVTHRLDLQAKAANSNRKPERGPGALDTN